MSEFIGWAIVFLLGSGGIARLIRFIVQSRVHRAYRLDDVVAIRDKKRKAAIEKVLHEAQSPTCFLRVEWWNSGHRAARDVVVDVEVDTGVLSCEIEPDQDDVDGGWELLRDPKSDGHLRLKQERLRPRTLCSLVLGLAGKGEPPKPTIPIGEGDRAVTSSGQPWLGMVLYLAIALPLLLLVLTVWVVWFYWLRQGLTNEWLALVIWLISSILVGLLLWKPLNRAVTALVGCLTKTLGPSWL